jgi:hypothetical protein
MGDRSDPADDRVVDFEAEVARLKLKGGNAEPERRLVVLGGVLTLVGIILAVAGWISSNGTNNPLNQNTDLTMSVAGLGVTVVGAMLWLRHSLTRYGRYWLARSIYEQRQQTDRLVEAVERASPHSLVASVGAGPEVAPPSSEVPAVESR